MSILDNLLKIEDDASLYDFTFSYKNTLMYPVIRFLLLQSAIEDQNRISSPYGLLHVGIKQKIEYILKSFHYRPKHIQSDIVFFGSDVSNIRQGNAYFNRLTELFANEYAPKTILIESADKMNYKRPRTYHKVFAENFVAISARIKSFLISAKIDDEKQINAFVQYLKQHFNYKFINMKVWDTVKHVLLRFSVRISFLCKEYTELLKWLSPKIVLLEDACYGGSVPIIIAARGLGIPIGEYQHGLISLSHPAYNYSAQLSEKYKYYIPDFYMSYGRYWMENSRIPTKVLEIGNPYLSETIVHCEYSEKKEVLLYISAAIDPDCYVQEVLLLKEMLANKGCEIMFRIHPSEVLRLQMVYKPIIDAGIPIDTQPLYETLRHTKYLLGDFSTVLFEASMFDCIIFVRDTPHNRSNVDITRFNAIQSMDELVKKICSQEYQKTAYRDFWADNWQSRYKEIIESYISYE